MDFSMKDIALITTMSGAIIFMSFTFPALGLADAGNETVESDVPEFNITSSQFDIAGEFPDNPGTPSTGSLIWNESLQGGGEENYVWLQGSNSDDGIQITITTIDETNVNASLYLYDENTLQYEDNYTYNSNGDTFTLEYKSSVSGFDFNYSVDFEVVEYKNAGQSNFTTTVDYTITEQNTSASWLHRIPIIGGIISAGAELAAIVGYIAALIWWFLTVIVEVSLTVIALLLEVMVFSISLMHWLLSTYFGVVTAAGSWAAVVLMLPGVMLFLEFTKLAMLGVKLLPTT